MLVDGVNWWRSHLPIMLALCCVRSEIKSYLLAQESTAFDGAAADRGWGESCESHVVENGRRALMCCRSDQFRYSVICRITMNIYLRRSSMIKRCNDSESTTIVAFSATREVDGSRSTRDRAGLQQPQNHLPDGCTSQAVSADISRRAARRKNSEAARGPCGYVTRSKVRAAHIRSMCASTNYESSCRLSRAARDNTPARPRHACDPCAKRVLQ
jgi:hypothetical protein